MKRSTSLSWLISRDVEWLPWWQELIINWVSSWRSVGCVTVTNAVGDDFCTWNLPTDLNMKRASLEELLH